MFFIFNLVAVACLRRVRRCLRILATSESIAGGIIRVSREIISKGQKVELVPHNTSHRHIGKRVPGLSKIELANRTKMVNSPAVLRMQ
jgi:hypothetical protein